MTNTPSQANNAERINLIPDDIFDPAGTYISNNDIATPGSGVTQDSYVDMKNPGPWDYVLKLKSEFGGQEPFINYPSKDTIQAIPNYADKSTHFLIKLEPGQLSPGETYIMSVWYAKTDDYNGADAIFHSRIWTTSGGDNLGRNPNENNQNFLTPQGIGSLADRKTITDVNGKKLEWERRYHTISIPENWNEINQQRPFEWYLGWGGTYNTTGFRYFADPRIERLEANTVSNTTPIVDITRVVNTKEGGDPGYFEVNIDEEVKYENLEVRYEIAGGSASSEDFYASKLNYQGVKEKGIPENILIIPKGSDSARIYITPIQDSIVEGTEDVHLSILPNIFKRYHPVKDEEKDKQNNKQANAMVEYEISNGNRTLTIQDKEYLPKNIFSSKFNATNLFEGKKPSKSKVVEAQAYNNLIDWGKINSQANTLIIGPEKTLDLIDNPFNPSGDKVYLMKQRNYGTLNIDESNLTKALTPGKKYVLSGWYTTDGKTDGMGEKVSTFYNNQTRFQTDLRQDNWSIAKMNDLARIQYYEGDTMFHTVVETDDQNKIYGGIGLGKLLETRTINGVNWEHRYKIIDLPNNYSKFTWKVGWGATNQSELLYGGYRYYSDLKVQPFSESILSDPKFATSSSDSQFARTANNATMSGDTKTSKSPARGIPLRMSVEGVNAKTETTSTLANNNAAWNIGPVAKGEFWTISLYAKASSKINANINIYSVDKDGNKIDPNQACSQESGKDTGKAGLINLTRSWKRYSKTIQIDDCDNIEALQLELKGGAKTNGGDIWWDGIQIERGKKATAFENYTGLKSGITITPKNRTGQSTIRAEKDDNNQENAEFTIHMNSKPRKDVILKLATPSKQVNFLQKLNGSIVPVGTTGIMITSSEWEKQIPIIVEDINPDIPTIITATTESEDHFYDNQQITQKIVPSDYNSDFVINLKESGQGGDDNEILPTLQVKPINAKEGERLGFKFRLSQKRSKDTIIRYSLSHDDNFIISGPNKDVRNWPQSVPNNPSQYSITIPARQIETLLSLSTVNDRFVEENESMTVQLVKDKNTKNYNFADGNSSNATATITDNDIAGIDFASQYDEAPVLISGHICSNANSQSTIVLKYNKPLSLQTKSNDYFTFTADGADQEIASLSINNDTITLTLQNNISSSQTHKLAYAIPQSISSLDEIDESKALKSASNIYVEPFEFLVNPDNTISLKNEINNSTPSWLPTENQWTSSKRVSIRKTQTVSVGLKLQTPIAMGETVTTTLDTSAVAFKNNFQTPSSQSFVFNSQNWNVVQTFDLAIKDNATIDPETETIALNFSSLSSNKNSAYHDLHQKLSVYVVGDKSNENPEDLSNITRDNSAPSANTPIASFKTNRVNDLSIITEGGPVNVRPYTIELKDPTGTVQKAKKDTIIFLESKLEKQKLFGQKTYQTNIPSGLTRSGLLLSSKNLSSPLNYSTSNKIEETKDTFTQKGLSDQFEASWNGYIKIPQTGSYEFLLTATGTASLTIDGDQAQTSENARDIKSLTKQLTGNQTIPIIVNYNSEGDKNPSVKLEWKQPDSNSYQLISSSYLTQISDEHIIIPQGKSEATFTISAIDNKIEFPEQELDIKIGADRKEKLIVSAVENKNNNQISLSLQSIDSTRDKIIIPNGTTLQFGNKDDQAPSNTVTLREDFTIYPHETYKGTAEYTGSQTSNSLSSGMVATSDDLIAYATYDDSIRLELTSSTPTNNILINVTSMTKKVGGAGEITFSLQRADSYSKSALLPKGSILIFEQTNNNKVLVKLDQPLKIGKDQTVEIDVEDKNITTNINLQATRAANRDNVVIIKYLDGNFSAINGNQWGHYDKQGRLLKTLAKINSQSDSQSFDLIDENNKPYSRINLDKDEITFLVLNLCIDIQIYFLQLIHIH